jgi:hypothetical protein
MGRPSTFDEAIAAEICERLAEGEPLRAICREEGMPPWRTVYGWMESNEDFSARIARGRVIGQEAILEDTLLIANEPQEGIRREVSETGVKTISEDMLGHRKLQIETRLKLLAKWNPKKYGEKLSTELTGANGGPLQVVRLRMTPAEELPDE